MVGRKRQEVEGGGMRGGGGGGEQVETDRKRGNRKVEGEGE